jgi:diacylglycerol O-acyltransferase
MTTPTTYPALGAITGYEDQFVHYGRSTPIRPNIGVIHRFAQPLPRAAIEAYARRLAANPSGFGRRLVEARLPGAPPHWRADPLPPEVDVAATPVPLAEQDRWLGREISRPLDLVHGPAWRVVAATTSEGAGLLLLVAHHACANGAELVAAVRAAGRDDPTTAPPSAPPSLRRPALTTSAADLARRAARSLQGVGRLGRELATVPWTRGPLGGDLAVVRDGLLALADRSSRRLAPRTTAPVIGLVATIDAAAWDATAAAHGGTGNSLQIAVAANLVRHGRLARGDAEGDPVRVRVPMYVRADPSSRLSTVVAPNVEVAGGRPTAGDLRPTRVATKATLIRATATAPGPGRAATTPGVVDAMALLPNRLTHRLAARVKSRTDAGASSLGELDAGILRIGEHEALGVGIFGLPQGGDLTATFSRVGDRVSLTVVSDAERLGPGPGLRTRVVDELRSWGLDATVL